MDFLTNFIFYHTPLFYLIQSIWRDEAFSYFMARDDFLQVIRYTATDFNPPLYYLLLHVWIGIVGKSDIWLRLLSLFFHLATVFLSFQFAKKLFSHRFSFFVAACMFLNPMLLYFAFEIRMYSLYAFLALGSLYFFYEKRWKQYIIFTTLGLYTHSLFILLWMSNIVTFFVTQSSLRKKSTQPVGRAFFFLLSPLLLFLPWIPVLVHQFGQSSYTWQYPVDGQLIQSVIGNIFIHFDGTPGAVWPFMFLLSLLLIGYFLLGFRKYRHLCLTLLIPIVFSLTVVLGYSILRRPIYVDRYLIFVAVAEIMALSIGIYSIRRRKIRLITAAAWIVFLVIVNIAAPPYRRKTDFKSMFEEINAKVESSDYAYTQTPIAYLESAYYYRYPNNLFVYNPKSITIPNYIGVTVVFPNVSRMSLPNAPSRTFFIYDDATYEIIMKPKEIL